MTDPDTTFDALGLSPPLRRAVDELGFVHPTAIQAEAIGPLLQGRDVIGRARTGSGKTAAFGLPLLQRVATGGPVRAMVLAPTRELALQVSRALRELASHLSIDVLTIYGGTSYRKQLRGLKRGATVVVGTPGRVIDLMDRGALDTSNVEYFVLDEADEMLRMGFIDDVEKVLDTLPADRQIALFSATMPDEIRSVAENYLWDRVEVEVEDSALSVGHIDQKFVEVPARKKDEALVRLLAGTRSGGTLVFVRTRARSADVAAMLVRRGVAADALHGDLNQDARERVLGKLRSKALDVVVATDVAARGLDVDHLTHVINYDMPRDPERYVHRIGRTARAGRQGTAITLVIPRDRKKRREFERELGVQIEAITLPTDEEIDASRRAELVDMLDQAMKETLDDTRPWVEAVCADRGWSTDDLAVAAVQLLRSELDIELSPPKSAPEQPEIYEEINECEVVIGLGRRDGIRPADIVGHFVNDVGIPADQIGKITLGARRVFVGLPRKVADRLVSEQKRVTLRNQTAEVHHNERPASD